MSTPIDPLDALIAAYVQAIEAGQVPDRRQLLDRNPDHAQALQDFFADFDRMDRVASPLRLASDLEATCDLGQVGLGVAPMVRYFGDYELLEELGRGGMGVVYKARQISLGRAVALKMLRSDVLASEGERQRFQNEAEAVALLDHPNIVPILEVGEHEGRRYFSMKLVGGPSLDRKLAEYRSNPKAACRLLISAAEAVNHAHQRGVLHRDLKPSNIVLDERGEPYLTDFGLAKRVERDSELTHSGAIVGTPAYMAPEQASGLRGSVTTTSDIYGLGAVLYALLTARAPFVGESVAGVLQMVREQAPEAPSRLNRQVPRDLEVIAMTCLEKDPRRRYGSALALADDLRRYQDGEPILARPATRFERAWKWARRRPAAAALLVVSASATLLLVAGLIVANVLIARRQAATLRALERERRVSYVQRIGLASGAIRSDNIERAEAVLDDCPTDLRRWEWGYLKRLAHAEKSSWIGHPGGATSLAFSPDGSRLATGGNSWDGPDGRSYEQANARVWNVATGLEASRFADLGPWQISAIHFSPDGQRLAVVRICAGDIRDRDPGSIDIYDAKGGGKPLVEISGDRDKDPGMFLDAAFQPDGSSMAVATDRGEVKIHDARTGALIRKLEGHEGGIRGVSFRADGARLASAGEDGTVRIWAPAGGRELLVLKGHREGVNDVVYSPDGRRLASCGEDRTVRIWDPETARALQVIWGHGDVVRSVAFSPDGTRVASCGDDGTVRLWDPETGEELAVYRGHIRDVNALAFHPDGKSIASVGEDGSVKLWDLTTRPDSRVLEGHKDPVGSLAFSPDGKSLASLGVVEFYDEGGDIRTWEIPSGRPLLTLARDNPSSLAYTPDSKSLAIAGAAKWLDLRNVSDGQVRFTLNGKWDFARVAISPDGTTLASAAQDEESAVEFRNPAKGDVIRRLPVLSRDLRVSTNLADLTFDPGGRSIIACWSNNYEWQENGAARCWDVATARVLWTRLEPLESNHALAYFPDGRRVAVAAGRSRESSDPGEVMIWDAADGHTLSRLKGHAGAVLAVAVSPDGARIASAGLDRSIKIWDADTGTEVLTLHGHKAPIRSLAFSRDGQYLASGDEDHQIRLWNSPPSGIR